MNKKSGQNQLSKSEITVRKRIQKRSERDKILVHLARSSNPDFKNEFPGTMAIGVPQKDLILQKSFQQFLLKEHQKRTLYLDSINRSPLRVNYGIDFNRKSPLELMFHQFFDERQVCRYFGGDVQLCPSVQQLLEQADQLLNG